MASTFTLYHYTPLSPLRDEYIDDGSAVILSVNCNMKDGRIFKISLIGTDDTIVLIRITIPSLTEKRLSNDDDHRITGLVEHMLSVLRLTYDLEADFVRTGNSYIKMTSFVEEGQRPRLHIFGVGREINPGYKINTHNIATIFCSTAKMKEIVRLAADSQHPTLPIQYRFLTLYKIFEKDFRKNKRWEKTGLQTLLTPFEEELRSLKLTQLKLFNFIIQLRDRCAHIIVGNDDSLGIIGLDSPDAQAVESFLPLFWRIAGQHLNERYGQDGLFEFTPLEPPPPREIP